MAGTATKTRTSRAKTTQKDVEAVAAEESVATADASESVVENKKATKKSAEEKPLSNDEEVEIVSLVPNVSYYDKATGDRYEWDNVGDIETMTVDAVVRMRRNHKGYFEDMCIKPTDARVIKKLNMGRFYDKYDYVMDENNYTRDNISNVMDELSSIRSNGMRFCVLTKIKDMVANGELSDVSVIRTVEKRMNVDILDFIV